MSEIDLFEIQKDYYQYIETVVEEINKVKGILIDLKEQMDKNDFKIFEEIIESENIKNAMFGNIIETLTKFYNKYVILEAFIYEHARRRGWYLPQIKTDLLEEINKLMNTKKIIELSDEVPNKYDNKEITVPELDKSEKEKFYKIIEDYIEKEVEIIIKDASKNFSIWSNEIDLVFNYYNKQEYVAAICIGLRIIDGLCNEIFDCNFFSRISKNRISNKKINPKQRKRKISIKIDSTLVKFNRELRLRYINSFGRIESDDILDRNNIIHGCNNIKFTKTQTLKIISLIGFFSKWKSALNDKYIVG